MYMSTLWNSYEYESMNYNHYYYVFSFSWMLKTCLTWPFPNSGKYHLSYDRKNKAIPLRSWHVHNHLHPVSYTHLKASWETTEPPKLWSSLSIGAQDDIPIIAMLNAKKPYNRFFFIMIPCGKLPLGRDSQDCNDWLGGCKRWGKEGIIGKNEGDFSSHSF